MEVHLNSVANRAYTFHRLTDSVAGNIVYNSGQHGGRPAGPFAWTQGSGGNGDPHLLWSRRSVYT